MSNPTEQYSTNSTKKKADPPGTHTTECKWYKNCGNTREPGSDTCGPCSSTAAQVEAEARKKRDR